MKPRGPLMIEHRLIEKVLSAAADISRKIKSEGKADANVINIIVDFIKTYADRTHHGKEEDILFKELEKKPLSATDREMMDELTEEHRTSRRNTAELLEANNAYERGDNGKLNIITEKIDFLTGFYKTHIAKEDKVFFPETEKYFTAAELDKMLGEFRDFDRTMIHEKYVKVYESLMGGM